MKCKGLFLAALFLLSAVANAQQKRAFLVGISNYDTALTGYQWNNINGVEDIKLLTPVLERQGFTITSLLDERATFANITQQMAQFVDKTEKGDIVYLHFSAHGQPVEDRDGDEEDGWDEAIVPVDAYKLYRKGTYEGEKHLVDDLLNQYVEKLRSKIGPEGFLYVVIDACHAGTSSRGNDDVTRGTQVGLSYNNKVFSPSIAKRSHYRVNATKGQSNVLFLEACRPDEVNTEIKVEGKHYGPLSFHIAHVLSGYTLATDANGFLQQVKSLIMDSGRWPNNQNLVTETSY